MSRRAQADVLVERAELVKPGAKARIRVQLFEALSQLGHVESIERYVRDVKDSPIQTEYSEGRVDFDRFTVIRVIGRVTPIAGQH